MITTLRYLGTLYVLYYSFDIESANLKMAANILTRAEWIVMLSHTFMHSIVDPKLIFLYPHPTLSLT